MHYLNTFTGTGFVYVYFIRGAPVLNAGKLAGIKACSRRWPTFKFWMELEVLCLSPKKGDVMGRESPALDTFTQHLWAGCPTLSPERGTFPAIDGLWRSGWICCPTMNGEVIVKAEKLLCLRKCPHPHECRIRPEWLVVRPLSGPGARSGPVPLFSGNNWYNSGSNVVPLWCSV